MTDELKCPVISCMNGFTVACIALESLAFYRLVPSPFTHFASENEQLHKSFNKMNPQQKEKFIARFVEVFLETPDD